MKLSNDLASLKKQLKNKLLPNGELHLTPTNVSLLSFFLDDCIDMARQLEASRVQPMVTQDDLADPKIALFPIAPRSRPVSIPIRTPDGDGVA